MKKIIISTVLIGTLLFTFTPSVQAKQELFKLSIPVWFSQAIQPFQNTLKTLTGKVDNHEARIAELEKKVADLEEKVRQLENGLITNQPTNNGQLSIEGESNNTLLNTSGSQTQLYTSNQGNLNIGSQTSGGEQLTITNPPNTESINLGNQNQPPTNQSQNQNCIAVGINGEPLPSNGQLIPSDQVTIVCE